MLRVQRGDFHFVFMKQPETFRHIFMFSIL